MQYEYVLSNANAVTCVSSAPTQTFERAILGNLSHARTVSSPGIPASWPLRILAAVTVDTPMPSPTKNTIFLATLRLRVASLVRAFCRVSCAWSFQKDAPWNQINH